MSIGELKTRIWNLTNEKLSYHEGCELTSFHIEDVEDGLDLIVEEMKADFPVLGIGNSTENACIDAIHKVEKWKKKWLGEKEET